MALPNGVTIDLYSRLEGIIEGCSRLGIDETDVTHQLTFERFTRDTGVTLDDYEEVQAREQVTAKQSLTTYAHVRSWEKIPRALAWSKSLVGKNSHRLQEHYVNEHDRRGVVLKFRARTNTLVWGIGWAKILPRPHMEVCDLSQREPPND